MADGHWGMHLWNGLGLVAFASSALLNAGVRLRLERKLERGVGDVERARRVLARLPLLDLTVLYLTVGDMIAKPSASDSGTLAIGGAILVVAAVSVVSGALRPMQAGSEAR